MSHSILGMKCTTRDLIGTNVSFIAKKHFAAKFRTLQKKNTFTTKKLGTNSCILYSFRKV